MRQVKREHAAFARRAAQLNFAAEQAGEFAADRKTETRAAVFAARACVGLLERLEDDPLLFGGNSDTGVGNRERYDRRGAAEHRMVLAPAVFRDRDGEAHASLLGELERIREQVLEHLLEALGVRNEAARKIRIGLHLEGEAAVFRFVPERAGDHVEKAGEKYLFGFDRDRSRLDLRKIEDVADQVEQVGAGAVDRAREFDLLRREVALGIVAELLAEDENAVERRAQLVRHVREEFGFVLGGERELLGLFFESAARLLDFLVLALDFGVLLGELLRFLRQLLVGLLQLFLLRLQLGGELLRLLQQASVCIVASMLLSTMPMLAVSCSRKARCEAVKLFERGQLDHGLHAIFEEHRQHDHVAAARLRTGRSGSALYCAADR